MTESRPYGVNARQNFPGSFIFTYNSHALYVYEPDSPPQPAGQPQIYGVSWNADGSLHVTGTLFNGISQGAAYGDDQQMDSNYPLARFTDSSGIVYYGRTYNWSSVSVQTGSKVVSTEVQLPAALFDIPDSLTLQIVANGNASPGYSMNGPVWVDFNYTGAFQFGDYPFPYQTLAQGVSAVSSGGVIAINASSQPSAFQRNHDPSHRR